MRINWLAIGKVALHIAVPLMGGFMGSLFTMKEVKPGGWYHKIKKPTWTPPSWLFGPMWTCIYSLMGVASYLVTRQGGFAKQAVPMAIYATNLLLNWVWTPLFFGAKRMDLAMYDITALWGSIVALIVAYKPVDARAAACMVPYLTWVSIATCLNYSIWKLNPEEKVGPKEPLIAVQNASGNESDKDL